MWIGSRVMSVPAKSRPMLTISRSASSVRRRGTLVTSSATVPSGKPRPSLISVCSARETTSREASSSLFGAYFSMNRSPSAFSSQAPSPRAPSVISSPLPGQRGRVVLDHLHVHQLGADPVGLRDPVAGHDQAVGGRLVGLAAAAGGQDHGLGVEHLEVAVAQVAADRADAPALVVLSSRSVVNHSS